MDGGGTRQSDFRRALWVLVCNRGSKRELVYFLTASFLLAAQRAFISWDRRFRPAGVRPLFFCPGTVAGVPALPAFTLAQRARAAAAILARVAADILWGPLLAVEAEETALPSIEARRFSSVSILLRIERASSSALRDVSMSLS